MTMVCPFQAFQLNDGGDRRDGLWRDVHVDRPGYGDYARRMKRQQWLAPDKYVGDVKISYVIVVTD